jgi:hypothetical protein
MSVDSGGNVTIVSPAKEEDLTSAPCVGVRYAPETPVKKIKIKICE